MLTENAASDALYTEVKSLAGALGLKLVEVTSARTQGVRNMRVILYREDEEINTDDLARAYNLIYPRYSVIYNDRDLQLEVSSPGLQRNLKDVSEFSIFTGRDVRVYSLSRSSYVVGCIEKADQASVTLSDCLVEDSGEEAPELTLAFSDIQKAKLEYRWEE